MTLRNMSKKRAVLQRGGKGESRCSEFFWYHPFSSAGNGGAARRNRENEEQTFCLNSGGTVGIFSHPESKKAFRGVIFLPRNSKEEMK